MTSKIIVFKYFNFQFPYYVLYYEYTLIKIIMVINTILNMGITNLAV